MNYWYPLAVKYGLDWIKVSNHAIDDLSPSVSCTDRNLFADVEREFTSPKVEFSYRGKRYFGYILVYTVVEHNNFGESIHHYNDDKMIESLHIMITDFLREYEKGTQEA